MKFEPSVPADRSSQWVDLLVAVDMGSNSFRLEIAQLDHGRYRRIDYLKEAVRLGAGLDADGILAEDAMLRGLACLERFAKRLEGCAPKQVRAVATQTLREARNRDQFLSRAQQSLGLPIEVISGREEARLIFAGVARLQPSDKARLVIDIGGRSTEMIIGRRTTPIRAESFQVGSVSLSLKYFADGILSEQAFRDAQIAAGAELEEGLEPFNPRHWREALGSSGTVGAVAQVLAANSISDGRITLEGLRWMIERCIAAGHIRNLELAGLKEDRRPVIGGGLAILYTLAAQFEIGVLQPARGALRQGVIFELDAGGEDGDSSERAHDIRQSSVAEMQVRFGVDSAQAERVARLALRLFVAAVADASLEARRELSWAGALHEVGMQISHHDHHRHSAYVLAHADAAGFSQNQLRRISELVLGQRGGLRKLEPQLGEDIFLWQVLALRVAAIFFHTRVDVDTSVMALQLRDRQAILEFSASWFDNQPRTVHLLHEEALAWARSGRLELVLEKIG